MTVEDKLRPLWEVRGHEIRRLYTSGKLAAQVFPCRAVAGRWVAFGYLPNGRTWARGGYRGDQPKLVITSVEQAMAVADAVLEDETCPKTGD